MDGSGSLIGWIFASGDAAGCSGGYESTASEELRALPCDERVETGARWNHWMSSRRVLYCAQAERTVRAARMEGGSSG